MSFGELALSAVKLRPLLSYCDSRVRFYPWLDFGIQERTWREGGLNGFRVARIVP